MSSGCDHPCLVWSNAGQRGTVPANYIDGNPSPEAQSFELTKLGSRCTMTLYESSLRRTVLCATALGGAKAAISP
jgi:hypothetical protein